MATRRIHSILPVQYTKDSASFDNQSAKEWVVRQAGEKIYQNFFEPLLHGKFGENIDDISATWMIERIRIRSSRSTISGEHLGYLEGGFSSLVDTLREKIQEQGGEIQLGAKVEKLLAENQKIKGIQIDSDSLESPVVINTTSPRILLKLTGDLFDKDYMEKLKDIRFQHTICILIGLNRKVTNTYWLNVANPDMPFTVLLEHTNFYDRIYGNNHILYLARYIQDLDHPIWKKSDKEIFDLYCDSLRDTFTISADNVLWWKLARGFFTSPIYSKGYLSKMVSIKTPIQGLFTAGMMHSYPERSINDSIRQGKYCANLVLQDFCNC